MSMTEDSADVSEFLEHFGIKGMKWGVRRADKKWERSFRRPSLELQEKIIKDANYKFDNEDLPKINNKPEYKKIDLTKVPLLQDLYFHEVEVAFTKRMGTVIQEHYGKNPSGTKEVTVTDDGYAVISEVEHSIGSSVKVKLKMDDTGHIVSADITQEFIEAFIDLDEEESMEQDSLDSTTEFLEHHGIKGMKWGVRRKRGSNGLVGGPRPKKGELGLEGKGRRPSDEGREAHKILAKQKKHGTVSLTNHELRTINARQKLEQEFIKVNPNKGKIEKGHDKVKKYLAIGVTAKSAYDLFNSPAGKALRGKGADNITQAQLNKYMWKQTVGKLGSY